MIYDNFRVTDAHDTVLDYAVFFFSVTLRDDNILEFDARWDEVLFSMSKTPSDDILESLCKLRIRESDQLKTLSAVRHGNSSEDIGSQLSKVENHGGEEYKSETSIAKLWRQAWENWCRSGDKESRGIVRRWKEEKVSVTSGKKKASVRKETVAVTKPKIVRKNQNKLPPHLLNQPHQEVEVCRGRKISEAKVNHGSIRADIIWKVLARERLVNIGIRPSANSTKMKRL